VHFGVLEAQGAWKKKNTPMVSRSLSGMRRTQPRHDVDKLRFYRLCNLVIEFERLSPVLDALQTIAEVVALLPY
jgi:hypothetical protein